LPKDYKQKFRCSKFSSKPSALALALAFGPRYANGHATRMATLREQPSAF
ncbi:MAG: hypothetical protein F6J98_24345, partial [Moorea sp. SIO4G2]|nr:hypothetical protein [Moorena sp. SIO4G2]